MEKIKISKNEFARHVGQKIGKSDEEAQRWIDATFESLHHFVKIKNCVVPCRIGEFTLRNSRNGFKTILWEDAPLVPSQNSDNPI